MQPRAAPSAFHRSLCHAHLLPINGGESTGPLKIHCVRRPRRGRNETQAGRGGPLNRARRGALLSDALLELTWLLCSSVTLCNCLASPPSRRGAIGAERQFIPGGLPTPRGTATNKEDSRVAHRETPRDVRAGLPHRRSSAGSKLNNDDGELDCATTKRSSQDGLSQKTVVGKLCH